MATTLSDIARRAHCSVNLVSYVLRKEGPPTKEKHREILRIARELNYGSCRTQRAEKPRTWLVTMFVNASEARKPSAFFSNFLTECIQQFSKEGIGVTLYPFDNEHSETQLSRAERMADGYLWYMCAPDSKTASLLRDKQLPSLCLYLPESELRTLPFETDYLTIDDYTGFYNLASFLYRLHHRNIVYAAPDPAGVRYEAYLQFCRDNHLPPRPVLNAIPNADFKNRDALQQYISRNGRCFTALLCVNDEVAVSLLYVLKSLDIKVPDEITVVGYDDRPCASQCTPSLTTIRQNYREIISQAVSFLTFRIEHPGEPKRLQAVYTQELVKRGSAGWAQERGGKAENRNA